MLSRRNFIAAALTGAAAVLGGCSGNRAASDVNPQGSASGSAARDAAGSAPATSADQPGDQTADQAVEPAGNAVLVAYFSATGHTEAVAQALAEHLGADLVALEPVQPYTEADLDYNDASSRTSQERTADVRPELVQITPDGWDGYQTVYLGYPIWWGEAAWPLRAFAAGNDFTGKVVVPFCTSASSSIGASGQTLAGLAGTGDWREGARFAANTPTADVTAWADSLGL